MPGFGCVAQPCDALLWFACPCLAAAQHLTCRGSGIRIASPRSLQCQAEREGCVYGSANAPSAPVCGFCGRRGVSQTRAFKEQRSDSLGVAASLFLDPSGFVQLLGPRG